MPTSIIAAVIGYAVSGAVASTIGVGILSAIAGGLASAAFNAAFSSKPSSAQDQPAAATLTDNLITVRQPVANWQYIYGRARVSGAITFAHESADQNFHLIVTLAGHVCSEIQTIQFNDEVIPLDGSGNATGKYAGFVRVQFSLGDEAGQPFPDLVAESEGKWTDAHRQSGRTKIYLRLTPSADLFPTGIPNITAIVKGKKVWDPRSEMRIWSDNASLCQADFLCDVPAGLEATYPDEIDVAQLIAAANIDDEAVTTTDGSEPRYTLNGSFLINSSPGDPLGRMLTANSGKVRYIGGLFLVQPAAYVSPTITLTSDDLRGVPHIIPRLSAADLCNGVKGLYISEPNLWQPSDFPPVTNALYLAEDDGERAWLELTLPFTKSATGAQRIAKIELERRRQQITVEWPGKFNCYRLEAGNTGMLTFDMMGWSGKVFEVAQTSLTFQEDASGGIVLGTDLVLRETAAGVFDWASGEETTVDLAPNTNLPNPFAVTPPTDLVLVDAPLVLDDGTVVPRIAASWTPSDYAFTTGWEVRFRIQGDPTWQTQIVTDPACILQPVSVGDLYDIEIVTLTPLGRSQTALTATGHVALGQASAPSAPTALTAVGGLFQVALAWVVDIGARRDIRFTEVWASLTNDRATAVRINSEPWPGTGYNHIGLSPGQHWFYWVRMVDGSGNHSAYYPVSTTAGVEGVPSTDPSAMLTQLIDSVGMAQLATELAEPLTTLPGALADDAAAILSQSTDIYNQGVAIFNESQTRSSADGVMVGTLNGIAAQLVGVGATVTAYVEDFSSAKVGYATKGTPPVVFDNNGTILDKSGVDAWNLAYPSDLATWNVGLPLATAVKQVRVYDGTGYAILEDRFTAQKYVNGIFTAKRAMKVDVNGHVTGVELADDGTSGAIIMLADKFMLVKPDGSGTPIPMLVIGTVNGVSALGFDGNVIIDGSIVADALFVDSLSAITANLGTVTTGRVQNTANTNYMNLDATGAESFLKVDSTVDILADGSATFNGIVISGRNLSVGSGTSNVFDGDHNITPSDGWKLLSTVTFDTGVVANAWYSDNSVVYGANAGITGIQLHGGAGWVWYANWSVKVTEIFVKSRWSTASTVHLTLEFWAEVDGGTSWISVPYPAGTNGLIWNVYEVT